MQLINPAAGDLISAYDFPWGNLLVARRQNQCITSGAATSVALSQRWLTLAGERKQNYLPLMRTRHPDQQKNDKKREQSICKMSE
jgi:hypothetical protein